MSSEHSLSRHFIRSAIDWLFRARTVWLTLIKLGGAILVTALGLGVLFEVQLPVKDGAVNFKIDTAGATPATVINWAFAIGGTMILVGVIGAIIEKIIEIRSVARKRVIVIEQRGLQNTPDTPLSPAVPRSLKGERVDLPVDLRQGSDGRIVNPELALEHLMAMPHELNFRRSGRDRSDISVVYGGLVSVPFSFLTGMLLDDESLVTIFDWDRNQNRWRLLDGKDDGMRFDISGLAELPAGTKDAVLTISVSYKVDIEGVRQTLGDLPMVQCILPGGTVDSHWSEDKQQALAVTFRDTVSELSNRGVRKLHIFIAAQNSMTFRFGRSYDRRNLPPAIVYQWERSSKPPHPWGVLMPVHGIEKPQIVRPEVAVNVG